MGSIAPVRRNNNRKASLPEEYDSSKQSNGTVLPLHHRNHTSSNNTSHSSDTSNKYNVRNAARRKRIRRSSNTSIYCCGVPVDVPVVGVVSILFVGVVLLVIGGTSFLHGSIAVGGDDAGHQTYQKKIQHRFERENTEHAQKRRRQHEDFEEDSKRLHHGSSSSFGDGHLEVAEVPGEIVLRSSPIRLLDENNQNDIIMNNIFDVVVTGAGPSGLTAALFASRAGLKVHVLGSASTGLLSQTKRLDNFPSFSGENGSTLSGPDWVKATLAQAKSWGATFGPPGLFATSIERQRMAVDDQSAAYEENKDVFFALKTGDKTEPEIRAWSVIVATGATPRTLGLRGEDALWGVSLHNCAICDGHLYQETEEKPSTVVVVGGGDAALDAAMLLARYATKVILVHRRDKFTSAHNLASRNAVRSTPNIEIVTPYVVSEWITKDEDPSQLVGVQLVSPENASDGGIDNKKRVDIDGAFVMIGATPNTKWTKNVGIALDEEGLIKTTADLSTKTNSLSSGSMITASSVPGLFAAGEVTDNIYKQAITAAAAGAQAAIDAERWLREQRGVTGTATSLAGDVNHFGATTIDQNKMEPVTATGNSQEGDIKSDDDAHGLDDCDLVSEDCIRSIVGAYPVVVFSKPYCPYCRKALEALSLEGLSVESDKLLVIDLSKHSNTQEIQSTLRNMTGRRTVPNVFVGGESIGGGDETRAFQQSGELVTMLVEAGALGDHNSSNDSSDTESCDLSSEECFRKILQQYPVLLFSLSWCPECKASLELLDGIGITEDQIHIIDLDDYQEIALDIRAHMKALTGRRSVPNLFVGGEFVGGYHQTLELRNTGDLMAKFQAVGALPRS
jgi:thioredoxin reductase (NADPH)